MYMLNIPTINTYVHNEYTYKCIRSFLALHVKDRLSYLVQGSLSINFSLLNCPNKEFGNKYFLILSQTYFCAKDKRILNLPKMK